MESEGGREDAETLGNHAGRQSFRSSRDEQAKQVQPGFLAERSESGECGFLFHGHVLS